MVNFVTIIKKVAARFGTKFVGLIAICCIAWIICDKLQFTTLGHVLVCGAILLLFIVAIIARWLWAHYRGDKLQKELQAQNESIAGRHLEVELLKEKMGEAITSLKSSELGIKYRGNAALYALPWYMIIGPSACGKSTLLRNSGLHFPFASEADLRIKGFGGTHNCDWWFSDEAIILDTAGRYTTEEKDKSEWLSFLKLLRKNRPRLPINGIIVAISLAELLTADEKDFAWHIKVIRDRIEELYNTLGYIFPITLLFTKVDLLQGFVEFFGDLSGEDREQVWGVHLLDNSDIKQKLEELYAKLARLRVHKLALEHNLQRKITIFDFPEQFHSAIPRIVNFIGSILKENPYQETPVLCGAYFTSGTQEDGNPIQRLLGNLEATFGRIEEENKTKIDIAYKSYFIRELFSKIIFPNKNAAAKTKKRMRLQLWAKSAGVIACVILLAVTVMLYSTSLTSNVILLHRGANLVDRLTNDNSIATLLEAEQYYDSLINYRNEIPWHLRMGLYRGNTQIAPLQKILLYRLQNSLATPMKNYLTHELKNYHSKWKKADGAAKAKLRGDYYTALKAYLMLGFPKRIDLEQAVPYFSRAWRNVLSGKNIINNYEATLDAKRYESTVRFYLQNMTAMPVDLGLASKARHQLYLPTNANNLYAQLKDTINSQLAPLTLHELLKDYGSDLLYSNVTVPGIYTAKAWRQIVRPALDKTVAAASQGDWVIDIPFAKLKNKHLKQLYTGRQARVIEDQLRRQLQDLYAADYAKYWFKFLSAISVQKFMSLDAANKGIDVLTNVDGPITQLLNAVYANINIQGLHTSFDELERIIRPAPNAAVSDAIKAYLHEVLNIQNDLQKLAASPDVEREAQHYAAGLLSGSGGETELYRSMISVNMLVNRLDDIDARSALKHLLLQPIVESWRTVLHAATRSLDQQWKAQIVSDYTQNIAAKFPFDRDSSSDAALSDVRDFFQPKNGMLWVFVNTYLKPFLFLGDKGWQEQEWLGIGAGFSKEALNALTQAKYISDGLFADSIQPGFHYQIYPEPTHGLSQIVVSLNGKKYRYSNGPQEWHSFSWPANGIDNDSYLSAVAVHGSNPRSVQSSGIWGVFHLLSAGYFRPIDNGGIYRVTWNLHGGYSNYSIRLLLRTNQRSNIFAQMLFNRFRLPDHLFAVVSNV